jgi:hypothetical protein
MSSSSSSPSLSSSRSSSKKKKSAAATDDSPSDDESKADDSRSTKVATVKFKKAKKLGEYEPPELKWMKDKFDGEDWIRFKLKMKSHLEANMYGSAINKAVDNNNELGEIIIDEDEPATDENIKKVKSAKAYQCIMAALTAKVERTIPIVAANNAYALWKAITHRYESDTQVNIIHLKEKYIKMKMNAGERMDEFINRINIIIIQLKNQDKNGGDEAYQLLVLLNGVPDSEEYKYIIANIKTRKDIKYNEACQMLIEHYDDIQRKKEKGNNKSNDESAHYTNNNNNNNKSNYKARNYDPNYKNKFNNNNSCNGKQNFTRYNNNSNNNANNNNRSGSCNGGNKSSIQCFRCNRFGHKKNECRTNMNNNYNNNNNNNNNNYNNNNNKVECSICHKTNHTTERCYKNPNNKNNNNNNNKNEKGMKAQETKSDTENDSDEGHRSSLAVVYHANNNNAMKKDKENIILDSGATCNMCNDITKMKNLKNINKTLTVASGHQLKMRKMGEIEIQLINCENENKTVNYRLTNVMYVPELTTSLMSTTQLLNEHGIETRLNKKGTLMRIESGERIGFCKMRDKLYEAKINTIKHNNNNKSEQGLMITAKESSADRCNCRTGNEKTKSQGRSCNCGEKKMKTQSGSHSCNLGKENANEIKAELWHKRMNHLNMKDLNNLNKKQIVNGMDEFKINMNNNKYEEKCESCLLGKAHRKAFGANNHLVKAEAIMDRWWCDTAGPIKIHNIKVNEEKEIQVDINSIQGKKYYNIIIDEYSDKIFFESFKSKDAIDDWVINTIKQKQNECGKKLKEFHSDNGSEFITTKMINFLKENGTRLTTTTPNTPQYNAKVERANRTLKEMARTILQHAKLSNLFCFEALKTSVYGRNKCASKMDELKSADEMWDNNKPNVKNMRVFGCDAYVHIKKDDRKAADPSAWKGIFVGYSERHNYQYEIFNINTNKIVVSRDVQFNENKFTAANEYKLKRKDLYNDREEEMNENYDWDMNGSNNMLFEGETRLMKKISLENNNSEHENENEINDEHAVVTAAKKKNENNNSNEIEINNNSLSLTSQAISQPDNNSKKKINSKASSNHEKPKDKNTTLTTQVSKDNIIQGKRERKTAIQYGKVSKDDLAYNINEKQNNNKNNDEPMTYDEAMNSPERDMWMAAIKKEKESMDKNEAFEFIKMKKEDVSKINIIKNRWLFKKKYDEKGELKKAKARWILCGYNMIEGVDYSETYAPVVRQKSLKLVLALATIYDLEVKHMDVVCAFLNAKVHDDVYTNVPQGWENQIPTSSASHSCNCGSQKMNNNNNKQNSTSDEHSCNCDMGKDEGEYIWVCKLKKAVYGIKQAPKEWNDEINKTLVGMGMKRCVSDSCIYIKPTKNNGVIIIALFVDDIVAAYSKADEKEYNIITKLLTSKYEMEELGDIKQILGMEVVRDRNNETMKITQTQYIEKKIKEFGLQHAEALPSPNDYGLKLHSGEQAETKDEVEQMKNKPYESIIGSELYASTNTRPDISYIVNALSTYRQNPRVKHWNAAKRVLKYLKHTKTQGLNYRGNEKYKSKYNYYNDWNNDETNNNNPNNELNEIKKSNITHSCKGNTKNNNNQINNNNVKNNNNSDVQTQNNNAQREMNNNDLLIKVYCDADHGSDEGNRKPTSGYIVYLNNCIISWSSTKQKTVSLSSCESEYVAMSEAVQEVKWIRTLLTEILINTKYYSTTQIEKNNLNNNNENCNMKSLVLCDNQSAIKMTLNDGVNHKRSRHIDIRHHYLKDAAHNNEIKIKWIDTKNQIADILTKLMGAKPYCELRDKMQAQY